MADAREEGVRGGEGSAVASSLGKLGEYPKRWKQFYHDVRSELSKVVWPSRQDVISTTVVVTITVAFFGVFFLCTDTVFVHLRDLVYSYFKGH
jgi:preprotein translocase subunit SecE